MSIRTVELRPYRLPLRRPWQSARGTLQSRLGWLVVLCDASLCGYGDCAPCPAAGTEPLRRARQALEGLRKALIGLTHEDAMARIRAVDARHAPAARCALETALLDLRARRAGLPLRRLYVATARDEVPVNAALGALDGTATQRARAAVSAGYRVLKIKVGLANVAVDLTRLRALADALPPQVRLRLDANGAWSLAEAMQFIEGLAGLPIDALEEPLRVPDWQALRHLQADCPFPLALDESAGAHLSGSDLADYPVRRLVLKPAAVGGPSATRDIAARAAAVGVEVVLTSVVESVAGLWPTLQLAATLPSRLAHGLATHTWFDADLGPGPMVSAGAISLPPSPGSGYAPFAA